MKEQFRHLTSQFLGDLDKHNGNMRQNPELMFEDELEPTFENFIKWLNFPPTP